MSYPQKQLNKNKENRSGINRNLSSTRKGIQIILTAIKRYNQVHSNLDFLLCVRNEKSVQTFLCLG